MNLIPALVTILMPFTAVFYCSCESDAPIRQMCASYNERPSLLVYSQVLNGDYTPLSLTPLSTWSWQEAVKAVWADKVIASETA